MNSTFFFEKGVVMKKQFDERNLTMVMDFYELTMANGYFKDEDKERKVAFDVFYRKNPDNAGYAIFAGLEQIIEYIENLHFDEDDIEYLRGQGLFGEEFLEFAAQLRRKRFIVGQHQRGPVDALDDIGHGEGLAAAGYAL